MTFKKAQATRSTWHNVFSVLTLAVFASIGLQAQENNSFEIPRLSNGAPDFNGIYGGVAPTEPPNPFARGSLAATQLRSRDNTLLSFEADSTILERGEENRPLYHPDYWEAVREADRMGNALDTAFNCLPLGLPRMGPPQKIVQTENELVFLYASNNAFRLIPTDGRPVNRFLQAEDNYKGYSVAHWEGDNLVVETTGFTDRTWLGWAGWIHSTDLRVVETMWWEDGELMWQATAHDAYLLEPYELEPQALVPSSNPQADLLPDFPCQERDLDTFNEIAPTIRG